MFDIRKKKKKKCLTFSDNIFSCQVIQRNQWGLSPFQTPENHSGAGLTTHGMRCAVWAAVKPTLQQPWLRLTLFLEPTAHCRTQWSEGTGEDVLVSLKAKQESVSPHRCGQLDVNKRGSQQRCSVSIFPVYGSSWFLCPFKYKDPSNTQKRRLGMQYVKGWFRASDLLFRGYWERWDAWMVTSCGSFLNTCRTTQDGGQVNNDPPKSGCLLLPEHLFCYSADTLLVFWVRSWNRRRGTDCSWRLPGWQITLVPARVSEACNISQLFAVQWGAC